MELLKEASDWSSTTGARRVLSAVWLKEAEINISLGKPAIAEEYAVKAADEFRREGAQGSLALVTAVEAASTAATTGDSDALRLSRTADRLNSENRDALAELEEIDWNAQVEADCGHRASARSKLKKAINQSTAKSLWRLEMIAKIELARLDIGSRNSTQAKPALNELAISARQHGYVRVAKLAEASSRVPNEPHTRVRNPL